MVAVALLSNIEASQTELISCIFAQLNMFIDDVVIIDFYSNDKLNRVLGGNEDIVKLRQYDFWDWACMKDRIQRVMEDFDKVIIFKTPIYCTMDVIKDMEKGIRHDKQYGMGYDKLKRVYERVTFVKAVRDKEVYQLVVDPRELDFSKVWKFKKYKRICAWKSETDTYGPIYEYAMANTYIQEVPKAQDLFFIGSIYNESRRYLYDIDAEFSRKLNRKANGGKVDGVAGSPKGNRPLTGKFEVFTLKNRKNRVSQEEYLFNLKLSRYTVLINNYSRQFNMVRFMEAIICDCVPLIVEGRNTLKNLELTFPDIYDIIMNNDLVMSFILMYYRMHHKYMPHDRYIIPEIKETRSYKKITDPDRVRQFYDKLLR